MHGHITTPALRASCLQQVAGMVRVHDCRMHSLSNREPELPVTLVSCPWPEIGFQPVFGQEGRVREYSVRVAHGDPGLVPVSACLRHAFKEAINLFERVGHYVPFSLCWPFWGHPIEWSLESLCNTLRVRFVDGYLTPRPGAWELDAAQASYPAALATFNIPMAPLFFDSTALRHDFPEFEIGLRVQLVPPSRKGQAANSPALRVTGLHTHVPFGLYPSRSLEARFTRLASRARRWGLPLLVTDVNDPLDLYWLRRIENLFLQGDVLSPPMSAACLDSMLAIQDVDWRSFCIGTRANLLPGRSQAEEPAGRAGQSGYSATSRGHERSDTGGSLNRPDSG